MVEIAFDLPYHEVNLMTGNYLRDRTDRIVFEAYIKSKNISDQCYANSGKHINVKQNKYKLAKSRQREVT